jgi:hypothetical protein
MRPTALIFTTLAALLASDGLAAARSKQPIGRWKFESPQRPIKAVLIGGSVAAWSRGGFDQFIEAACPRVEIRNRAKAKLGARALRERFQRQVLRNRRIDREQIESLWLIFMGGLNSVGTPMRTNRDVAATLAEAHEHGLDTLALTVGPWGAEHDRRWRGGSGNRYQDKTRATVDFLMGRLTPRLAFGPSGGESFGPGQLADIAVDLYDSDLRDRAAPLRDEAKTHHRLRYDKELRRELRKLPAEDREAAMARAMEQARAVPQWFMREDLQAFDHIHPNMEGHRIIARTACPSLPEAWSCDCARIETLVWDRRVGGLVAPESPVLADPAPAAEP